MLPKILSNWCNGISQELSEKELDFLNSTRFFWTQNDDGSWSISLDVNNTHFMYGTIEELNNFFGCGRKLQWET
jgi:hypothetical protein